MPIVYLVRHGQAAAGFAEHADPGLDPTGHAQARAAANALRHDGALRIASSPLARARETATPFLERWPQPLAIEPRIAEIPSPGLGLEERAQWLGGLMQGRWQDAAPELRAWADDIVGALLACREHTLLVSHFVAINVAVGAATADDRVLVFRPGNASVTVFDTDGGRLRLVALGDERATHVN